jgi:Fic family protein
MVSVISREKNGKKYLYLKHSTGNRQKEKYLGLAVPKNIDEIKKEFLLEFYNTEWDEKIKTIIKNYKKELKKKPLSVKQKDFENLGISFTYNTQRMEGSTLTEADTKDLLVYGVTPAKKSKIDSIETAKHYELFMRLVTSKATSITKKTVLDWHREIFSQTKVGEAGNTRSHRVGVITNEKIEFAPVPEIPKRLQEFFSWLHKYNGENFAELAALAHYKFVSIHPFGDGNGRISRLIMNYILFIHECPLMLIKNNDRRAYFKSLEKSQLNDDSIHFLKWFMKYYIKSNRQYL